jgi:hypothetical protein
VGPALADVSRKRLPTPYRSLLIGPFVAMHIADVRLGVQGGIEVCDGGPTKSEPTTFLRPFFIPGTRRLEMDWRDEFDHSLLNEEALAFLVQHELEDSSAGITKQVMMRGLGSLKEEQTRVFKKYVVDNWLLRKCKCGGHTVEGHELIGLWMNDGYCARCAGRMDKD